MYKVALIKDGYMKMEFVFKHWGDATLFMSLVIDNKDDEIDIRLKKIVEEGENNE